ncbi:hypothetical protein BDR06DRAFT_1018772 [Suillus hirtellus]|nr:hypothetical protein BDR06DRAFT_1018772 [Suillus hirtellus]
MVQDRTTAALRATSLRAIRNLMGAFCDGYDTVSPLTHHLRCWIDDDRLNDKHWGAEMWEVEFVGEREVGAGPFYMLLVRHTFSTLALINERRQGESYLFIARDTDGVHCLDLIHTFASNVFVQLSSLSPAFTARTMKLASDGSSLSVDFELTLFSEAVKNVDCAIMQSREVNTKFEP